MYICQSQSPNSSHSPFPPLYPSKNIFKNIYFLMTYNSENICLLCSQMNDILSWCKILGISVFAFSVHCSHGSVVFCDPLLSSYSFLFSFHPVLFYGFSSTPRPQCSPHFITTMSFLFIPQKIPNSFLKFSSGSCHNSF